MATQHGGADGPGTFLVGLDIGGSHTRGVLFRGDAPVREARAGSANVQNVGPADASRALRSVLTELHAPSGTPVIAGAGGVDTPHDAARLADLIRSAGRLPASTPVQAVHDTRLILAAGGHTAGIAVIAGTGSVAWGVDISGREARAGGWGYLLGDEGSGWWLGREAVRRVLRNAQATGTSDVAPSHGDGHGGGDRLARAVLEHAGVETPTALIAAFHGRPERTHWAGLARAVCELAGDGDAAADELATAAAHHLAQLPLTVAYCLDARLPTVVGGGLTQSVVGRRMAAVLRDQGVEVTLLDREPVLGVPLLARATQS